MGGPQLCRYCRFNELFPFKSGFESVDGVAYSDRGPDERRSAHIQPLVELSRALARALWPLGSPVAPWVRAIYLYMHISIAFEFELLDWSEQCVDAPCFEIGSATIFVVISKTGASSGPGVSCSPRCVRGSGKRGLSHSRGGVFNF